MIHARTALYRQAQAFFHEHLIGIYSWDDVESTKAKAVERAPGEQREAGKTHDTVDMRFGPFDLEMAGPFEAPPCGLIRIKVGQHSCEGPLDATTWRNVGNFVKQHNLEEYDNGSEAGDDWGR